MHFDKCHNANTFCHPRQAETSDSGSFLKPPTETAMNLCADELPPEPKRPRLSGSYPPPLPQPPSGGWGRRSSGEAGPSGSGQAYFRGDPDQEEAAEMAALENAELQRGSEPEPLSPCLSVLD